MFFMLPFPDFFYLNDCRLPELPNLSEVACIHVDLPESPDMMKAKKALKNHGKVLSKAPVQIASIQQRPGALNVKWTEVIRRENI